MVECDLAKVEVAGSNPVSRSKFSACEHRFQASTYLSRQKRKTAYPVIQVTARCAVVSSE